MFLNIGGIFEWLSSNVPPQKTTTKQTKQQQRAINNINLFYYAAMLFDMLAAISYNNVHNNKIILILAIWDYKRYFRSSESLDLKLSN